MEFSNFVSEREENKSQKTVGRIIIVLVAVILLLGIVAGSASAYIYRQLAQAKDNIQISIEAWKAFDLNLAKSSLFKTQDNIAAAKRAISSARPFYAFPWIGKKLTLGNQFLSASEDALVSYQRALEATEDLVQYKNQSYQEIENKKEVIQIVSEVLDVLEEAYLSAQEMLSLTHDLGIANISVVQKFEGEFNKFQKEDFELLRLLSRLAGQEGEGIYLLLMQNNTELRPTGGYIGNFGILKIKDGEITEFYLKDTDELESAEGKTNKQYITPPAPLAKYFSERQWRFGDANWSPSFPETARNAQDLYNIEVASVPAEQKVFDGVIAFNPELVNDWLKIIGGVTINITENIQYTTDNFSDTPQNLYPGESIDSKIIKEKIYIVDAIAQEVRNKMLNSSIATILQIVSTLRHNIEDNSLFFYFNEPELQEVLAQNNWTGALQESDKDYLYVVDANLSNSRIDHLVKRQIGYTVTKTEGKLVATLRLDYQYDASQEDTSGLFQERIEVYKTYTRIYVPRGAQLISHEGIKVVDVVDELGKTVFGALITVKPDDKVSVILTYELPLATNEEYKLILQKQPGNEFADFRVALPFAPELTFTPEAGNINENKDGVTWHGRLDENQEFIVFLK